MDGGPHLVYLICELFIFTIPAFTTPLLRLVNYTVVEILTPMYYIVEYDLNHTHHSRAVTIRF